MDIEGKMRFPLREAYAFASENGLDAEISKVREMDIEWDRGYKSTIRRSRVIRLFQQHNLLPQYIERYWPFGSTPGGEAECRRCLRIGEQYDEFVAGRLPDKEVESETMSSTSFEFALEAHLRDFLARNLEEIEPGLKLYQVDGRPAVEFAIDNGRIDILAVDIADRLVVIELKLSQGRNKTLGQLMYYMGWIDSHLSKVPCRGIIIASDISGELGVAVSRVPGVSLYRYKMNFSVELAGGSMTQSGVAGDATQ
ncbi:MAG: DUF91 domain-containing protein [Phycisphaeraceae bacterium]|nr:DUF91 domain-containing protein [Phycisphaeraceae bacterium]